MTEKTAVTQSGDAARNETTLLPPVDVIEDAGGITLYADLPGVPKDKLNLQVEADTLTIDAEVAAIVEASVVAARAAPRPDPAEVATDVYVSYP